MDARQSIRQRTAFGSQDSSTASLSNARYIASFGSLSRNAALAVTAVGVAVLIGWMVDNPTLKSIHPSLVTMKANTALAFLLSGAALLLQQQGQTDLQKVRIARWCAVVVALIGLLTLAQFVFGRDFGIDQLLFKESAQAVQTSSPGRMAPNTAFNFLLMGLALRLLDAETASGHRPAEYLALAAFLVALLALLGYAYDVKALYGFAAYTKMALHTVAAFLLLAFGILTARPQRGFVGTISSDGAGGKLARHLLPAAVAIPVVVGWLCLEGARAGFYGTEFRLSLTVLLNVIVFSVLIWRSSRLLEEADARVKKLMQETQETVGVLASSSSEITAATTQVAAGSAETATAVSQTTSTVEEVKQTAHVSSDKARHVSDTAQKAAHISQSGRKSVEESIESMHRIQEQMESIAESIVRLSEQSQAIGEIIATVNDLAEQSNMLAVNAAIEAAKAGEQGKGFAVVAQEVKSLSEQSKQATTQVRAILGDIQKATSGAVMATEQGAKAVEAGVKLSGEVGDSIQVLAGSIEEAAQAALQIAASAQQQLAGMDQVALAIQNINQASVQNVASTKQAEAAAKNLHELGVKLKGLVEQYQV